MAGEQVRATPAPRWPGGKRFAFTIFDDTDGATVDNVKPVYDFLRARGLRTTKSVWPLAGTAPPAIVGGATCADPHYRASISDLARDGFEIGFHNATYHSSERARTVEGLDRFAEMFGRYPRAMANHTVCREGIYWGDRRVSGLHRVVYNAAHRFRRVNWFRGHQEGDPHFWGDVCAERIDYVRNFVFSGMNTLAACPLMPYHDPDRSHVRAWFASSEGPDVASFNATISEAHQDALEAEGGACIMYTHLARGFWDGHALDRRFVALVDRLSRKGGWFVPTSELLDHLRRVRSEAAPDRKNLLALERKWLLHKFRVGTT